MAEPEYTFSVDIEGWDPETRRIWGRASAAIPDHENEIIEIAALEEALPDFLALPALMYNHTDRPIGLVSAARFTETEFYVEGNIKATSDCDDVWAAIESGTLKQFSIGARRRAGTPACRLRPEARREPCRTTALDLYSISLCPTGAAQNPTTFLEIRKALYCPKALQTSETPMPEEDMTFTPPGDAPAVDEQPAETGDQIVLTADAVAQLFDLIKQVLAAVTPAEIEKADDEGEAPAEDEPKDDDEIQKAIKTATRPLYAKIAAMEAAHTAEMDTIRKARVQKVGILDLDEARRADHRPGNAAVISQMLRN